MFKTLRHFGNYLLSSVWNQMYKQIQEEQRVVLIANSVRSHLRDSGQSKSRPLKGTLSRKNISLSKKKNEIGKGRVGGDVLKLFKKP